MAVSRCALGWGARENFLAACAPSALQIEIEHEKQHRRTGKRGVDALGERTGGTSPPSTTLPGSGFTAEIGSLWAEPRPNPNAHLARQSRRRGEVAFSGLADRGIAGAAHDSRVLAGDRL